MDEATSVARDHQFEVAPPSEASLDETRNARGAVGEGTRPLPIRRSQAAPEVRQRRPRSRDDLEVPRSEAALDQGRRLERGGAAEGLGTIPGQGRGGVLPPAQPETAWL